MDYQARAAVWEITMQCNMRCKHCGSSCDNKKAPKELSTEEALKVIDDMGRLKMNHVTISGGEPLLRNDWPILALHLKERGIIANMISNGWNIDEDVIKKANEVGLTNIAISIDGQNKPMILCVARVRSIELFEHLS